MHINVKSYSSDDLLGAYEPGKDGRSRLLMALGTGLMFWLGLIGFVFWIAISNSFANGSTPSANDPMVMKVYPDGTKIILRWSEVGKSFDNGSAYGGAPKIMAYDPAKDGVVPIGQAAGTPQQKNTNEPTASPIAAPTQNTAVANPKGVDDTDNYGPTEGFDFRTAVGAAFQQTLSGRSGDGLTYLNFNFNPGIRFDLEPSYNVTEWFRTGVETSFIYNSLQRLSLNEDTKYPGDSRLGNAGFYQVPILANVRFQFPTEGPYRGYAGGGIGAAWDVLQASDKPESTYTSYRWNFVYQLTAGFSYTVMPGLDLDLAYKMISTPNPNFQDLGHVQASYNHTVEIGLNWRF